MRAESIHGSRLIASSTSPNLKTAVTKVRDEIRTFNTPRADGGIIEPADVRKSVMDITTDGKTVTVVFDPSVLNTMAKTEKELKRVVSELLEEAGAGTRVSVKYVESSFALAKAVEAFKSEVDGFKAVRPDGSELDIVSPFKAITGIKLNGKKVEINFSSNKLRATAFKEATLKAWTKDALIKHGAPGNVNINYKKVP